MNTANLDWILMLLTMDLHCLSLSIWKLTIWVLTTWIKWSNWLKIRNGRRIAIYSALRGLMFWLEVSRIDCRKLVKLAENSRTDLLYTFWEWIKKEQKDKKKLELSEDLAIAPLQRYQIFLAFIVPEKTVTNIFKNGKSWKPTKGHNSKSNWPVAVNFATTPSLP